MSGGDLAPLAPSPGGVRVDRVVTAGPSVDGSAEVRTNVWVVGDDRECLIIDAAHDGRTIVKSIDLERRVQAVLCTHAHSDHIDAVGEVCDGTRAPAHLHPDDRVLWDAFYPVTPDRELADGQVLTIGDVDLHVIHTPGHTPGSCCFHAPALGVVFSGDALDEGGRDSDRLLALPGDTVVLPGHGDPRRLGA